MLNLPTCTFTNAWIRYTNVQKLMQVYWFLIHTQPRKLNHEVPRLGFYGRPTRTHNTTVSTHGLGISNAKVLLYSHLRPSIGIQHFLFPENVVYSCIRRNSLLHFNNFSTVTQYSQKPHLAFEKRTCHFSALNVEKFEKTCSISTNMENVGKTKIVYNFPCTQQF